MLEDLIVEGLLCCHCFRGPLEKGCEILVFIILSESYISNEIEGLLYTESHQTLPLKKVINISAISAQKIKSHGMIMFHGLRNVDNPYLLFIVKHIVFRKVAMDKTALMIHSAHNKENIRISLLHIKNIGIFQTRCTKARFTNKFHDNNIVFKKVRFRSLDETSCHVETLQVTNFFFGPELDHFTGI